MEILKRLKQDKETRNKLILTMVIMFALLIGYRIPLPGINTEYLKAFSEMFSGSDGVGSFINAMTGGSFSNMSIFALSIAPYITASILLQLFSVIFPALEAMQKDGSVGRQKMERLTYLIGAIVALIEALALAIGFGKKGLLMPYTWYMVLYATVIWVAGACFLIWVGQTIQKKLIGNGISLILMFNILTTLPGDAVNIYNSFANGDNVAIKVITVLVMIVAICLVFAYVVVLNNAEKRIHITNSHKAGVRMKGANDNVMPLKLNMGGVMPIIFSSSIMSLPVIIGQFAKVDFESTVGKIIMCFNQGNWFNLETPIYTLGILLYIPLTYFFSYFYAMISFNTKDIADNLRKSGSVINGIRPGQPTAEYLDKQAKSMLILGTTMLLFIALLPTLISGLFNINGLSFGGTTIIIIVGVILEMKNTLTAKTSSVAYKSLVRKGGKRK